MSNNNTNEREFYCFISYKHRNGDKFYEDEEWAEALAFSLTQLHIPAETKPPIDDNAFINLNPKDDVVYPVFRDSEVLNAGGVFSQRIVSALEHSRKLVVIISDEMIKDQEALVNRRFALNDEKRYEKSWCYREIFYFLKSHTWDDIIPVYIGTNNEIQNIIPSILTKGMRKRDIENNAIRPKQKSEYVDSLNYWKRRNIPFTYSNGTHKPIKDIQDTIAAKVAAYIFGADADQFRNYQMAEEERRLAEKKRVRLQFVFGTSLAAIIISVLFVSVRVNSSQVYLSKARRALSDGDRKGSIENSLQAYSKWCFTEDLTATLWESLDPSTPYMSFESEVAVNREKGEFAVIREKQYVDIYDFQTMSNIKTYEIGHGSSLKYSPAGNRLAVFSKKDLTVIDLISGELISKKPFTGEIKTVRLSQNGDYVYCPGLEQVFKFPNLDSAVFMHPRLPYYSYTYSSSNGSFMGTEDRLAFTTKAYNISGKSPSDTLWAISVFDLSKKPSYTSLMYDGKSFSRHIADIYQEMPDSVSFIGTYSDQPFFYYSTPSRVNYIKLEDSLLINWGWHRYDNPVKGWFADGAHLVSEWNESPKRIVNAIDDLEGKNFILVDQNGIKYRLSHSREIKTSSPAQAKANTLSFYDGPFLATQDTLSLFNDRSGNLYLGASAPYDNNLFGEPLSGIRYDADAGYSIQKYKDYQFVSEIHEDASGKIVKTLVYYNQDLRGHPLPVPADQGSLHIHYLSPDLSFALASSDKEFGVYLYKERHYLPICPSLPHSSLQDSPLYWRGNSLYVLAPSYNHTDVFDIIEINLATKQNKTFLTGVYDIQSLSYGIVLGHREDKTLLIDLNDRNGVEEYPGLLDIKKDNGFYSVSRRTNITENSYSNITERLLFRASTHLMSVPSIEEDGFVYSSANGKYTFIERFLSKDEWHDTVEYTFLDGKSLSPIAAFTGESAYASFHGITSDERYFYYSKNGLLVIYDLKKNKEIRTTYRIDRQKERFTAAWDNLLFFPGNTFKVIDLSNGKVIMSLPEIGIKRGTMQLSFSPDRRWLLVGENLFDLSTKQIVSRTIPLGIKRKLTNEYIVYEDKALVLPHKIHLIKIAKERNI